MCVCVCVGGGGGAVMMLLVATYYKISARDPNVPIKTQPKEVNYKTVITSLNVFTRHHML